MAQNEATLVKSSQQGGSDAFIHQEETMTPVDEVVADLAHNERAVHDDVEEDLDDEEIEGWAEVEGVAEVISASTTESPQAEDSSEDAPGTTEVKEDKNFAQSPPPLATSPPPVADTPSPIAQLSPADISKQHRSLPPAALQQTPSPASPEIQADSAVPAPAKRANPQPEIEPEEEAEQQAGSTDGQAWGWGGWSKLGASLREAAAGAARDVKELTDKVQQALIEDESEEEEEERLRGGASTGGRQALHEKGVSSVKPGAAVEKERGTTAPPAVQTVDDKVPPVAPAQQRLEDDETLEVGLKAIDDQVEQLAAGVQRTFGGLLGNARGLLQTGFTQAQVLAARVETAANAAAREIAETLDEGVRDVREVPAFKAAASGLANAAGNTKRVGGMLATTARGLLDPSGRPSDPWEHPGVSASHFHGPTPGFGIPGSGPGEAASFERCFYEFGGRQSLEELESLANECSRLCNRIRAKLPEGEQAALDARLATLGAVFDLEVDGGEKEVVAVGTAEDSAISRGHAVVSGLRAAGVSRAVELAEGAKNQAAETAAKEEAGATEKLTAPLEGLRREATSRVAEVAALCVERLLALGRSVGAQFRYGRPADDGIAWPRDAGETAAKLRAQALRMLADVEALATAFLNALAAAGAAMEAIVKAGGPAVADGGAAAAVGGVVEATEKLYRGVEADGGNAAAVLRDAFRALLYVVVLTTLDRRYLTSA